jgi:hypothetical protein
MSTIELRHVSGSNPPSFHVFGETRKSLEPFAVPSPTEVIVAGGASSCPNSAGTWKRLSTTPSPPRPSAPSGCSRRSKTGGAAGGQRFRGPEGRFLFEKEDGSPDPVRATALGALLPEHPRTSPHIQRAQGATCGR